MSKPGRDISGCQKRKASKERKKHVGLEVTTFIGKKEEAHVAQHEWPFSSTYTVYDPSKHDTCLSVGEPSDAWYFDSGVSKYITSCKKFCHP